MGDQGMHMGDPGSLRELRAMVDALVADGAPLPEIEVEVIEPAGLSEDLRDALWLYAWGCTERQRPSVPA